MKTGPRQAVEHLYRCTGIFGPLSATFLLLFSCANRESSPGHGVGDPSRPPVVVSAAQDLLAGGSDGSGGKGVVCREPDGSVRSVELLDLWEERVVRHHQIVDSGKPVADRVHDAIDALKGAVERSPGAFYQVLHEGKNNGQGPVPEFNASLMREHAAFFLRDSSALTRLRGNVKLTLTRDSYEPVQPTGDCHVEQLVNFLDSDSAPQVLVNQDLLEKMDDTNKAALFAHEAFYAFLRGLGSEVALGPYRETDSIRVRRAIGYLFSGHSFRSIDELVGTEYVSCNGKNSSLYLFRDAGGQARVANASAFGKPAIGFFPEQAPALMPWRKLVTALQGRRCPRSAAYDPLRKRGYGPDEDPGEIYQIYRNPGVGPSDFQLLTFLDVACSRHHTVIYLLDGNAQFDPDISKGSPPQKLLCEITPSEKPR